MRIATIQLITESTTKLLIADLMKYPNCTCSYKLVLREHKLQSITTTGELLGSKRATSPKSHRVHEIKYISYLGAWQMLLGKQSLVVHWMTIPSIMTVLLSLDSRKSS